MLGRELKICMPMATSNAFFPCAYSAFHSSTLADEYR